MNLFPGRKLLLLFTCILCIFSNTRAQSNRIVIGINDNWKFHEGGTEYANTPDFNDANWEIVHLPHTWNAKDPFDDNETYFRGIGWYRKNLQVDPSLKGKKIFILFEGANQVLDLYVNGAFAGEHKGGYTAFSIDITSLLKWDDGGNNSIAVQVNNAHDNFIPPLSVGYALYGGIYRNVWMIATDDLHFTDINNNAKGVYITTPKVNEQSSFIRVRTNISNESAKQRNFQLVNNLIDQDGQIISSFSNNISVNGEEIVQVIDTSSEIANPKLWSPENPYLYHLQTKIVEDEKVLDEVSNAIGFRWFGFDSQKGFFLNGKKYILHGTNRHQDRQGKGSALSDEDQIEDLNIIKNMGANFLRLAHYPQAPEVLRLADQLGIIIWEEIPVVNYMNIDPEFLANAENMLHEMIYQNFNHPAIIMWGSMNEILLHSKEGVRIQKHVEDSLYVKSIKKYAIKLDSVVRAEDPSRYSTMAMHGSGDYARYGLDKISQVAGHNLYDGWYSGKVEAFGNYLDKLHKEEPDQNIFISEYGAGSDRELNSSDPKRLDFTGQYQRYYHENYLRQINARPYLGGTAIWNEFDFSQPNIGGPMSNQNNKGMLTWDRKYKDVYFLYKANWNPNPMVYIATRDWLQRAGYDDTKYTIDVYTNTNDIAFYLNGNKVSTAKPDAIHKCSFSIQLKEGDNLLEAVGKADGKIIKDAIVVHNKIYPHDLSKSTNFSSIYINVGSNAQYTDDDKIVWLEDQPYKKGEYGYLSGTPTYMNLKYMIKNTDHTPLYYSYLDNVSKYKVDVPDGNYLVELYFIEPEKIQAGQRIFNVSINSELVARNMDMSSDTGYLFADKKSVVTKVINGEGITISLEAIKGKPVLSGLKIIKY